MPGTESKSLDALTISYRMYKAQHMAAMPELTQQVQMASSLWQNNSLFHSCLFLVHAPIKESAAMTGTIQILLKAGKRTNTKEEIHIKPNSLIILYLLSVWKKGWGLTLGSGSQPQNVISSYGTREGPRDLSKFYSTSHDFLLAEFTMYGLFSCRYMQNDIQLCLQQNK